MTIDSNFVLNKTKGSLEHSLIEAKPKLPNFFSGYFKEDSKKVRIEAFKSNNP
jgi:hypothetical protein